MLDQRGQGGLLASSSTGLRNWSSGVKNNPRINRSFFFTPEDWSTSMLYQLPQFSEMGLLASAGRNEDRKSENGSYCKWDPRLETFTSHFVLIPFSRTFPKVCATAKPS